MLILTRKLDESIIIGDNIIVQVLETRGGQTRIGIIAPRDISVHRSEIYKKIHGHLPENPSNVNTSEESQDVT